MNCMLGLLRKAQNSNHVAFLQMWALTPNLPCVGMLKQVTGGKVGKKSDVEVLGTWRERLSSDQPVAQKLTNDLFLLIMTV